MSKVETSSALTRTTLAAEVEAGTAWEATATTTAGEPTSASREAAASLSKAAAATSTHHVEEDLGVDTAHATAHATHSTHATASTEHIGGVNKVVAVVVAGFLSTDMVSKS